MDLSKIKGAIFDADGTLLDSMWMWGRVEMDYLLSLGVTPKPDLFDVLRSIGGHDIPAYYQTEYGVRKTAKEIDDGICALMFEFYSNRAAPKQGAAQVVEAMLDRGVRVCVATATDRYLIEEGLRRCDLLKYFGRVFTCREENTKKSSPDIFIRAADYLGTSIGETLVIEDSLYAMRSAKRAGFPVVAIYDDYAGNQRDEIRELCDYYFMTLGEMLEELEGNVKCKM